MSLSNPDQDDILPVSTQSHNGSRCQTTAVKDDASVAVDDSRRIVDRLPQICPDRLRCQPADDEFESEKYAIYRHSLFPLLALLFERCEQATHAPDCAALTNLKSDIQLFVQHQQQRDGKFSSDDPEVDSLMLRAIQTLRIHLLELEKVNELCKDFCSRYIACLRAKMQNEQLLHLDSFDAECMTGAGMSTRWPVMSAAYDSQVSSVTGQEGCVRQDVGPRLTDGMTSNHSQQDIAMSQQVARVASMKAAESTDRGVNNAQRGDGISMSSLAAAAVSSVDTLSSLDDIEDEALRSQQNKRGLLPQHSTHILKSWLFHHLLHPYPSEEEKRMLAAQTNMTVLQISNWFINARRRLIQPAAAAAADVAMAVDNQESSAAKRMKTMLQSEARTQFWSAPPRATSVSFTSHTAAMEEAHSLSSTPSSTTFEYDYVSQSRPVVNPRQHYAGVEYTPSSVLLQRTGTPSQLVSEPGDVTDLTQPVQLSVAGQCTETTPSAASGSVADVRETVASSSDSAAELPSLVNASTDSPAVDKP